MAMVTKKVREAGAARALAAAMVAVRAMAMAVVTVAAMSRCQPLQWLRWWQWCW